MSGDWITYFAYGSNLHPGWLARRVPSARVVGSAWLPDHGLEFRKRGRDGSAKSDAVPRSGSQLPGALYAMHSSDLGRLGAAEGGYLRVELAVRTGDGPREAFAYMAREEHHVSGLPPWDWYVGLIIAGAELHDLPETHRTWLASVRALPDPDPERAALARAVLES